MTFHWWTFLLELINFLVLAYVLQKLLYRPLRDAIDRRQAANQKAMDDAESARREAESSREQSARELAEVERQRRELLERAAADAAAERQRVLAAAEATIQRRQTDSREAMQQERQDLLASLKQDVVAMSLDLTERMLRQGADRSLQTQLARVVIEAVRELSPAEREELRTQWHPDDGAVLEIAGELENGLADDLQRLIADITGTPVTLTTRVNPQLIAGSRLRVGGLMWDNSAVAQWSDLQSQRSESSCVCVTET